MTNPIPHRCQSTRCLRCAWNSANGGVPNNPRLTPKAVKPTGRTACAHLGADTGGRVQCRTCSGRVELKIMACAVHGKCTVGKPSPGIACCVGCPDFTA